MKRFFVQQKFMKSNKWHFKNVKFSPSSLRVKRQHFGESGKDGFAVGTVRHVFLCVCVCVCVCVCSLPVPSTCVNTHSGTHACAGSKAKFSSATHSHTHTDTHTHTHTHSHTPRRNLVVLWLEVNASCQNKSRKKIEFKE